MVRSAFGLWIALGLTLSGCANFSAKITGSPRAGTEQLLLTGTSDRAMESIDFRPLAGARVYLDTARIAAPDAGWVIFSLRRAMARQGLLLVDGKKEAQVIVEAALGAYGTDEVDTRWTLPFLVSPVSLPFTTAGLSPQSLSRNNRQDAVVKLALIAYDATSRRLIWESGTILQSQSLDRKFIGAANVSRSSTLPELQWYPPRRDH
jgi:hypothetical protein